MSANPGTVFRPMMDLELSPVARRVVEEAAKITSDDDVVVITEPDNVTVGRAIATAARSIRATASILIMPGLEAHGNEPPAYVAAAMAAADVAITATTHSITHTQARHAASDADTRVIILRGVTTELMVDGGINTDYEELREVTRVVRDVLEASSSATVTAPSGTNIQLNLAGSSAFALDGFFHDYGFSALPPGESPTKPQMRGTSGTIVVDYSMDNIGLLEDPIEFTVEDGTVTSISGSSEATRLRELIRDVENARNLAEFAIGTNRDARLVGNLAEDKKKRGTVHFAIGDDTSLGGTVQSDIHLDGLVLEPSVELDGTLVLEDGTLLLDSISSLHAEIE